MFNMAKGESSIEFVGPVVLPGEDDTRDVVVSIDEENQSVSFRFSNATIVEGENVNIVQRIKYLEAVFTTSGLPKEDVELTWKFNAGHASGSLAGVVIAKPNPHRITGEKGFSLEKV